MKDIIKKLKQALKQSCDDAFLFSDDETRLIDAEYLLTVNAAKAIQELNTYFGTPYRICLENKTQTFCDACTSRFIYKRDHGKKSIGLTKRGFVPDVKRPGEIDIAIYKEKNMEISSYCAIETKGFNPSKRLILMDLNRNLEYFSKHSQTGKSKIEFTIYVALHSYKNTLSDAKEQRNIDKVKKRYDNYIKSMSVPQTIKFLVDVFTIRRGLVPNPDDPFFKETGLEGTEDYHFIGVLVVFNK